MILYVVECGMAGYEHSSFNSSVAMALGHLSKHSHIDLHFFGEHTQQEIFKNNFDHTTDIHYHKITVTPGKSRRFIKKNLTEFYNIFSILRKARRQRAVVLFLSVSAPSMAFFSIMRYLFPSVKVHLILHGLDGLIRQDKWKITSYGFWNRLSLLRLYKGPWPNMYVLGDGIRNRLIEYFPKVPALNEIKVLEHPFNFSPISLVNHSNVVVAPDKNCTTIGFIGFGRRDKGVEHFYRLAKNMSDLVEANTLKFILIGELHKECERFRNKFVIELGQGNQYISSEQYYAAIKSLDCAVFFLNSFYTLTASGSVFDAISFGVKIIALSNPYIEDIKREDSDNGITTVADIDEMEEYLRKCLRNGLLGQRYFYTGIKEKHSIAGFARALNDIAGNSQ